jgi:hypothetical protein
MIRFGSAMVGGARAAREECKGGQLRMQMAGVWMKIVLVRRASKQAGKEAKELGSKEASQARGGNSIHGKALGRGAGGR